MKIRLTGYIDVPSDRITAISAALPEHIRQSRDESGCIQFDVAPSPDIKGRFMINEMFVDQTAFDTHQSRTQASDWAEISRGIPREYQIEEIR